MGGLHFCVSIDKRLPGQRNLRRQTEAVLCDTGRTANGTDDTLSAVSTDGGGDGSFPGKSGIFLGYAELLVCKENRIDPLGDQACCVFV